MPSLTRQPVKKLALSIPEKAVLKSCKQTLDYYRAMRKLDYFRITTTGKPVPGGRFAPNPDQAGFPDLLIWLCNGIDLYVEVKRPGGQLSDKQQAFKVRAESFGKKFFLVESSTQLQRLLELYLSERPY
jgi:VRR-NUC domain